MDQLRERTVPTQLTITDGEGSTSTDVSGPESDTLAPESQQENESTETVAPDPESTVPPVSPVVQVRRSVRARNSDPNYFSQELVQS